MLPQFNALIQSFASSRVLLIGDLILDEYRRGTALGLSAETPTIVARDQTTTFSLGGAGLLCRNILALGGKVKFVSLVGDDDYNQHATRFRHPNLTAAFLEDTGRKTTVKTRFWVNDYKLLQWDRLDNGPIPRELEETILSLVGNEIEEFDKLIVSDYRHGLISETLAKSLVELLTESGKPLYVDSQVSQRHGNHDWYSGANLFCVNAREALTVNPEFESRPIETSLATLRNLLKAENIVVKLGEKGCIALLRDRYVSASPPTVQVIDTTGAGDAFFSVLSLAPEPLVEDHLFLANTWAALSTTVKGAQPPTLAMLNGHLGRSLE